MAKIAANNKFSESTKSLTEILNHIEYNMSKEDFEQLSLALSQVMNEEDYTKHYGKGIFFMTFI